MFIIFKLLIGVVSYKLNQNQWSLNSTDLAHVLLPSKERAFHCYSLFTSSPIQNYLIPLPPPPTRLLLLKWLFFLSTFLFVTCFLFSSVCVSALQLIVLSIAIASIFTLNNLFKIKSSEKHVQCTATFCGRVCIKCIALISTLKLIGSIPYFM